MSAEARRKRRALGAGAALLFGLLAAGCAAPTPTSVRPPAEVGYLAIVELDGRGEVVAASKLVPWQDGTALPVYAQDASSTVLLLGYPKDGVDALAALAGRTAGFEARLRPATGCEQALPAPAWLATWGADGAIAPGAVDLAPRLTVAGVEDACPDLSTADVTVDLRCPLTGCPAVVTTLGRCSVALDLSSCDFGRLHATFDAAGRACVEPEDQTVACELRADDASSSGAYACSSPRACALDVYRTPRAAEPPYLRKRQLFEAAPWLPSSLTDPRSVGNVYQGSFGAGWVYDLIVLPDRVLVAAAPDGTTPAKLCLDDHAPTPTRLYTLDLELSTVRSSTAPPCLHRMTPDPLGSGFLAPYTEGETWRLGRFDAEGRLVASAASTLPWDYWQLVDLVVTEGRVTMLTSQTGGGSRFHVHALDTLAEEKVIVVPQPQITSDLLADGPATLQLVLENSRQLARLDLDTEVVSGVSDLPEDLDHRAWVYGGYVDRPSGRVLVGARGAASTYIFRAADRTFTQASLFDADTALTSFAPWPEGQAVLAGGVRPNEWRATLSVFDPREPRFLGPPWVLGHGPVGRMRAGPGGRVWLVLPWAGTVAVVGPS